MGQMVYEIRTLMEMLGYRNGHAVRRGATDTLDSDTHRLGLQTFLESPCPQFRVDAQGQIQVANPAFAQFVGRPVEMLPGSSLETTHLARVYPDLRADLWDTATHRKPLQRVLTFRRAPAGTVSMLLWLVPEPAEGGSTAPLTGIILPLSCPDAGVGCPNRQWPPRPLGDRLTDQS
jgi:PAS domain-containing protein